MKKKYIIEGADSREALMEKVNRRLEEGYFLVGGVVSDSGEEHTWLLQTLVSNPVFVVNT